jgi:hypothetical protein
MSYAEHSGHAHYVTARRGQRVALLAGPFRTHREALEREDACRRVVRERFAHDMAATFAEIGTTRTEVRPGRTAPAGRFTTLGLVA